MSYRRDEGGAVSFRDESHRTHDWWDITKDHEWNSLSIFIFNIFMAKKITQKHIHILCLRKLHYGMRKTENIKIAFSPSKWKYCLV